jgi:hypothetical protein
MRRAQRRLAVAIMGSCILAGSTSAIFWATPAAAHAQRYACVTLTGGTQIAKNSHAAQILTGQGWICTPIS